ncbi:MAG: hypothetical protein L0154_07170 [Chloroflexi bacterium]|nr:hypothetical protein [Chloroflexota bacterium]
MSKRVCIFLLLIILSGTLASATKAQSGPVPYIFYHSTVLNAFVIERADGTDSRIIGEGITPFDQRAYPRPGWSPSGQWLVWITAIPFGGPGDVRRDAWGVSVDGTQRLTLLNDVTDVRSIGWSPAEDLLFMLHDRWNIQASLIDVAANRVVMSSALQIHDSDVGGISWTPDGQYVTFYYSKYPDSDRTQPRQYFLRVISRKGEVSHRQVSILPYEDAGRAYPIYSTEGWLLYATPDKAKLVADNVSTGERLEFDMPPLQIHRIEWSFSGDYAAVFTRDRCANPAPDCPSNLWLLTPSDQTLEKVAENVIHQSEYVQHDVWSPSQDVAVFTTPDRVLHMLEAEALTITDLELPLSEYPGLTLPERPRPYWFPSGDRWLIPELTYEMRQQQFAYEYNLTTQQGQFYQFNTRLHPLMSANGAYYVSVSGETTIFRLISGEQVPIPRHSGAYFYANDVTLYSARWHPTSNWLVTGVAHDQSAYLPASVISADGKVYRELGSCYACVDWLPEQVDLANLPPGTPTSVVDVPDNTFETGAWVDGLRWSPDGTRLAVGQLDLYSNTRDPLKVQQWELNAAEPTQLFSILVPPDTSLDWQKDEDDNYILLPDEDGKIMEVLAGISLAEREIFAVSPDGNLAIRYTENYMLVVTDETTGETLVTLPLTAGSSGFSLLATFSPDGTIIAGVGPYSQLHIWDAATGDLLTVLNVFSNALAFSPDGRWLATGMGTKVALWDMTSIVPFEADESSNQD